MATIEFDAVTKRYGADVVAVDSLDLQVEEGEFLILVGPSGCGKTTALRMVAGLEEVTDGEIRIDGRRVNDLPPPQRDIAMVFQNYALYPHMTVAQNIGFPLKQQRVKRDEARLRVGEVAELLGIEELLARRPRELSGGQRQRVAIGRALVRRPQVFLMDEPLSNLDAKLRVQMRAELIDLHRRIGITTIYVTHDQTEAMTLGDRVVVMRNGVVQQVDEPDTLYRFPENMFVASFIGSPSMNFLTAETNGRSLRVGSYAVELPAGAALRSRDVVVGLRPEDVKVAGVGAGTLGATVEIVERLGPEVLVHLHVDGVRPAVPAGERELADTVVARFDAAFDGRPGDRIAVTFDQAGIRLFDAGDGLVLSRG